jgi:transglutaminase-like putative cysteine protease
MIYDIRQTTTYSYASPVAYAHHVLRLMPINRTRQRVHAAALEILPVPVERREGFDFFGNRLTWIGLDEPHDSLAIKFAARVAVEAPVEPLPLDTSPWEAVRAAVIMTDDIGPDSPAHFLFPSPLVSLDPGISDYARTSFPAERPVLDGAIDLMRRIKADFVYDAEATTVTTTPASAFALRRGVCQDFAHIMISGLRGIGLPAAYVSGYLRTVPKAGRARLAGADAMHAWVMVWCGARDGWWGLDPTNALLAGEDHIVLAVGRDYSDIAPVAGVVFASGEQRLETSVDVIPVTQAPFDPNGAFKSPGRA